MQTRVWPGFSFLALAALGMVGGFGLVLATCEMDRPEGTSGASRRAVAVGLPSWSASRSALSVRPARERFATLADSLRRWRTEADPLRRDALLKELLAQVTDANVADITRTLSPELLDTPFGELVLKRWAGLDHLEAARWLETLSGGASELQAGLVTYGWLATNRGELHAYVDGLSPGLWRERVITAATNDALLLRDGPEAAGLLLRLPSADQRDTMLGWASTQWAMQDPVRAAEWARDVADSALQRKLFGAVAIGYAWRQPEAAAALLVSSGVATAGDAAPIVSVMNIWGRTDPAASARWACGRLEGEIRRQAIRCAVTAWGYQDLPAAQVWIGTLPQGEVRAQAERTAAKIAAALEGREASDEI
jgi:hypothetical protein